MADQNQQSKSWEQQIHEARVQFEQEIHRLVKFFDTEVVPEVRRNSSIALRTAATKLNELATHMDNQPQSKPSSEPTEPR